MRMNAVPFSVIVLSLLVASEAMAAPKLLAVLPLDARNAKVKMDDAAKASLEDVLRDEAANALSSAGWSVLTGENTYALLRDNGVDPTTCDAGECHVATARELNVEVFISGVVHYVDGELVASVRLMDTKTGRILSSERIEAQNTIGLRHAFEERAARFFARAGLTNVAAEKPTPIEPLASPPPKPPEQVILTPPPPHEQQTVLPPPVAPVSKRRVWGWVAIGAAAVITAGSIVFDVKAPSSNDRRLGAIDFLPVGGYALAAGLTGIGIYNVGSR